MFARLKTSGKAVYVQIIAHVPGDYLAGPARKVVVATLGRVDHLGTEAQEAVRSLFSKAVSFLRPTRNVLKRPLHGRRREAEMRASAKGNSS